MELEDGIAFVAKFLGAHGHGHLHVVHVPLSPLSTVHPHAAVTHKVLVLEVVEGVHHGSSGTHMGAVRIHQVVV